MSKSCSAPQGLQQGQVGLHEHVEAVVQLTLKLLGGPHALTPEPARLLAVQHALHDLLACPLSVSACAHALLPADLPE